MSGVVIGVVAFGAMVGIAVLIAIISAVAATSGHLSPSNGDED